MKKKRKHYKTRVGYGGYTFIYFHGKIVKKGFPNFNLAECDWQFRKLTCTHN